MPGNTRWKRWEIGTLRDLYPIYGANLPELDRTPAAVRHQANKLGVEYKFKHQRWVKCINPECETPWMPHCGLGLCECCYNVQYYQKNKEKLNEYSKQKYWENREARLEYNRKYRELARSLNDI